MDSEKKRFAWGVGLAWGSMALLFGPSIVGAIRALRGVGQNQAVGLAAIGTGGVEAFVTFGFIAFVACQVGAVVMLVRGVKREAWTRSMVSVVSVVCSVGVLVLIIFFAWWWMHLGGH